MSRSGTSAHSGTQAARIARIPTRYLLGTGIVILVAVSAFLDDLLEQRPLRAPDFLLGLLLAAVTAIALICLDRVASARQREADLARRRHDAIQGLRSLGDGGKVETMLDHIVNSVNELLKADGAIVIASDWKHDHEMVVVAVCGGGLPVVGTRIPTSNGIPGAVLDGREPVLLHDPDPTQALEVGLLMGDAASVAAAPICWGGDLRGMIAVGIDQDGRRLRESELEVVCELAELSSLALEQVDLRQQAQRTLASYVEAFALALEVRDQYTGSHSDRVVELSSGVGERIGLSDEELEKLELAARMHDIGKLGVPDAILNKQGTLNQGERAVMREHPAWGAKLLWRVRGLEEIARIVRAAHERWDGGGYPDGLSGAEIPRASRIILACDAFHAMTSNRPYCAAMGFSEALEELRTHAGSQFDPLVIETLITILEGEREAGSVEDVMVAEADGSLSVRSS